MRDRTRLLGFWVISFSLLADISWCSTYQVKLTFFNKYKKIPSITFLVSHWIYINFYFLYVVLLVSSIVFLLQLDTERYTHMSENIKFYCMIWYAVCYFSLLTTLLLIWFDFYFACLKNLTLCSCSYFMFYYHFDKSRHDALNFFPSFFISFFLLWLNTLLSQWTKKTLLKYFSKSLPLYFLTLFVIFFLEK